MRGICIFLLIFTFIYIIYLNGLIATENEKLMNNLDKIILDKISTTCY